MTEKVSVPTIRTEILNAQYWFSQNVSNIERMLGVPVAELTMHYSVTEGVTIEYTPQASPVDTPKE